MTVYEKSPNGWSCLPTAFAIVLGVPVKNIIDFLNHDGSEVLWPNLPEPRCRRSFHVQEVINYCLANNYAVTESHRMLGLRPIGTNDVKTFENPRYLDHMKYYNGVFTNEIHAFATLGGAVIDPASGSRFTGQIAIHHYFIVQQVA